MANAVSTPAPARRDLIDRGPRWLRALADCAVDERDDSEAQIRKRSLAMTAAIGASANLPWALVYITLGFTRVSVIPLFYVVVTTLSLLYAARTKQVGFLLNSQLAMYLVLPVLVHVGLGGFANSSGVVMYASIGVVGALSFADAKSAGLWFAGFAIAVLALAPFESTLAASAPYIAPNVIAGFFAVNIVATALITFLSLDIYVRSRKRLADELVYERSRSDRLLLNVLPESIADRLKDGEQTIADRHDHVAVLFVDIVEFTPLSESLEAAELVNDLNALYSEFDRLTIALGVEKVKTIGDAFMAMTGTTGDGGDSGALIALALSMQAFASTASIGSRHGIELRAGIDVGPVVAGVIGESRFIYDVYGETVNMASRMESHGVPGKIQITQDVKDEIGDRYSTTPRGVIDVKGVGAIETYLITAQG
jgi:guanylate cyclase